jgi:hypothetical protein
VTDGHRRPQNPDVTIADAQLSLRTPVWARVWTAVFPVILVFLFLFVIPRENGPAWLGGLVALVLAPVLSWRLFRLAAVGRSDGLMSIRNHWRDRTVRRDDIAEVRVHQSAGSSNRSVALALRDGSIIRLDVTEVPFGGPFKARLDRQAAEVRAWVEGRPRPFL